jgi:hypothetical protein
LLIGAAAIATAGVVGMKLLADGSDAAVPITQLSNVPSPATPATAVIGRLADGVSVAIIGIHEDMFSPTGWWQANGDPVDVAPCTGMQYRRLNSPGNLVRAMVLQINREVQGSPDPATVDWTMTNTAGWSQRRIENPNPSNAQGFAVSIFDTPQGSVLHARVASGRWTTIATRTAQGMTGATPGKVSVLMGEPFAIAGNVHIEVAHNNPTSLDDFRLVAFDLDNKEVVLTRTSSAGWVGTSNAAQIEEYTAPVPPAEIHLFEFQTRPFNEFIEIQNISMHANQKTMPLVKTSDGR